MSNRDGVVWIADTETLLHRNHVSVLQAGPCMASQLPKDADALSRGDSLEGRIVCADRWLLESVLELPEQGWTGDSGWCTDRESRT